jgi:hypothetical protein
MIARFRILLPNLIALPLGHDLAPYEREVDGERVRIFPPFKSRVDRAWLAVDSQTPFVEIGAALALDPLDPPPVAPGIEIDGDPVFLADALRVDVLRDEFDRRLGAEDPPAALAFKAANDLLGRLRMLSRAAHVKPVVPTGTVSRVDYLKDDGTRVPEQEGLKRGQAGVSWRWQMVALRSDLWRASNELPADFRPPPWDTLFLDASNLLPEVGPALVLAFAALETLIDHTLDILAPQAGISDELWEWIKTREADYRKEPSVTEQFDPLLRACTGASLKDEPTLWEAFRNLKTARNTFVHEGEPQVGGQRVSADQALRLVIRAGEIIEWIEARLPAEHRRPRYSAEGERMLTVTRAFSPPEGAEGPGGTE